MVRYSEVFFESYSMAVEAAYEAYMKIVGGEFPKDAGLESKLKLYLENEYRKWLDTPLEKLGGKTPTDYMDSVEGLDNMMILFRHGAVICDDGLPEIYLRKLRSYGEKSIDMLINLATQENLCENDDAFLAPLTAVRVLGMWKVERAVEPLIGIFDSTGEMFDLMYETIKDALVNIGDSALDHISAALESGRHSQAIAEYLLMAYADIGKRKRSDQIFALLKKSFLGMPDKLVAASCLGDYGDGRAIPVLRGCLEKNAGSLNRETYYEIVSAIKKLGGRTDDLQ